MKKSVGWVVVTVLLVTGLVYSAISMHQMQSKLDKVTFYTLAVGDDVQKLKDNQTNQDDLSDIKNKVDQLCRATETCN